MEPLPCMEPLRCFLRSKAHDDLRLSLGSLLSLQEGVTCSKNTAVSGNWSLYPVVGNGATFVIQSAVTGDHHYFLQSTPDGKVNVSRCMEGNEWEEWRIEASPDNDCFYIVSQAHKKKLAYESTRGVYMTDTALECAAWTIEFTSGELCFLSSPLHDTRIRCDAIGMLGPTKSRDGWEIWRLVEASAGHVFITSWTHQQYFLSSSPDGQVFTTKDRSDSGATWVVNAASKGGRVDILSSATQRSLGCDGSRLYTTVETNTACQQWHLEPAHKNVYFVSSVFHAKRIGCGPAGLNRVRPFSERTIIPFATGKRGTWEEWEIEKVDEGLVALHSKLHGVYLGVNAAGEVASTSDTAGENEHWYAQRYPIGGVSLISKVMKGKHLSCDDNDRLCLVDDWQECGACWKLEPRLPDVVTTNSARYNVVKGTLLAVTVPVVFVVWAAEKVVAKKVLGRAVSADGGPMTAPTVDGGSVATLQSIGSTEFNTTAEDIAMIGKGVTTSVLARSGIIVSPSSHEQDGSAGEKSTTLKRSFCNF